MAALPMVSVLPLAIVVLAYLGGVRFGCCGCAARCAVPASLLALVVGTAISWGAGYKEWDDVADALRGHVPPLPPFTPPAVWRHLGDAKEYLGVILPVALTNLVGTIECVESAERAGDAYGMRESMVADGVGTLLGASFGSVFGTTVYIGHPACVHRVCVFRTARLVSPLFWFVFNSPP